MAYIPFRNTLKILDINHGDILWVASDVVRLLRMMKINGDTCDLNYVIDSLQDTVGNEGTLLFPTFNWDFCQGLPFDYHKTPSMTGSLSRTALQRRDFRRTKHPIYSFAVWGKYQDLLYRLDNTDSFGPGSPFDFVYKHQGKYLQIGIGWGFTFFHYAEQAVGVPYRFMKNFTSSYINEEGEHSVKTYSMHVRNLEMDTKTEPLPMYDEFEKQGIMKRKTMNDIPYLLINDLNQSFDAIKNDIINNKAKKLAVYNGQ
jgi:aminoglycoside 3-N-acetyltransferase